MMQRIRKTVLFLAFIAMAMISGTAYSVTIGNYSGCKICDGAIVYSVKETKALLGEKGFELAKKIKGRKKIKIDLDGVLKNGSAKDPDKSFEVMITGGDVVFIKDLIDGSIIQIVLAPNDASQNGQYQTWAPRMYLQSGISEISLKDSVEDAWGKMRQSGIYQWVIENNKDAEWNLMLKKKILEALTMLSAD